MEGNQTKAMIAAKERGPGPGRYALPTGVGYIKHDLSKKVYPAYSFGQKLSDLMIKKDCSPGPAHAIDPKFTRHGKDGTPQYSILGRQKDQSMFKNPAPGQYSPEKAHPQGEAHAPCYSMSSRTRYRKRDSNPSANSYNLPQLLGSKVPNKKSSASYSMTSRLANGGFSEDLSKTPGPGQYDHTNPNIYVRKAPFYSMLGRSYIPGDSTQKPGPGAHYPERVYINKRSPPKFSMGIRHSDYITPLIVEVTE
ncbi:ciliary microtubule associated protein 1A-like [Dysidea avara]|uniref:ciliary microtubule associated protein 1A-like n=1 Tax=Dysidea avara TaxID=196820 RepID=UPI0033316999